MVGSILLPRGNGHVDEVVQAQSQSTLRGGPDAYHSTKRRDATGQRQDLMKHARLLEAWDRASHPYKAIEVVHNVAHVDACHVMRHDDVEQVRESIIGLGVKVRIRQDHSMDISQGWSRDATTGDVVRARRAQAEWWQPVGE